MSFLRRPKIEAKTTEQILLMREAGLVVGKTLQRVRERAVPGITTGQLDALAEEHIRSLDSVPSFKGYHGFPGSLCVSVNEEVVHGIPGERVLHEGDLVSIDCGAIFSGWHGDAAISLIVGGPKRAARRTVPWSRTPRPPCGPASPPCAWVVGCSTSATRWRAPSRAR